MFSVISTNFRSMTKNIRKQTLSDRCTSFNVLF